MYPLGDLIDGIDGLAFSPGDQFLALVSESSGLLFWDLRKQRALHPVDASLRGAVAVAFGRAEAHALLLTTDSTTALADVASGTSRIVTSRGAPERPMSSAIDPARHTLAFGTNEGYVALVDLDTGKYRKTPFRVKEGEVMGLAFLDATHLVGALTDGNLFVWDTQHTSNLKFIRTGIERLTALAFSPTSKLAAVGDSDGALQLWDTESWRQIGPLIPAHIQAVQNLSFDSDGVNLASNSPDGQLRVWNLDPDRWAAVTCPIANRQLGDERTLFDLHDAGECPSSGTVPPWQPPSFPPGFVPVKPRNVVEPGATRAIV